MYSRMANGEDTRYTPIRSFITMNREHLTIDPTNNLLSVSAHSGYSYPEGTKGCLSAVNLNGSTFAGTVIDTIRERVSQAGR